MKNISKQKFVMLYTLLYLNHNWKGRNKPLDDYYVKQAALTDFITVEILKTVAQPDFYESRENDLHIPSASIKEQIYFLRTISSSTDFGSSKMVAWNYWNYDFESSRYIKQS